MIICEDSEDNISIMDKMTDSILAHFSPLPLSPSSNANQERSKEYNAALCIQRWFRGCRVRAYLKHLHDNAIIIQSHYRGYLGRAEHRRRLKVSGGLKVD